jgi:hypothetical protein
MVQKFRFDMPGRGKGWILHTGLTEGLAEEGDRK